MNDRMLANSVLFSLALGLTVSAQAQVSGGTTTPPAGAPGVTPPALATPNPPLTPPAQISNPTMPTLPGANVPGPRQEVPGSVTPPGQLGTAPGLCPCSVTTPNTRPPVGGCNC